MRSLNRVTLMGNVTADPDMRTTAGGSAFCTFTIATNREWKEHSGEKREEAQFTRLVAWDKLGELCNQLLARGSRVYVEGRLSTRSYTDRDNNPKQITEVVLNDMVLLTDGKASETPTTRNPEFDQILDERG